MNPPIVFATAAKARESLARCEYKECRVVRSAQHVFIQTPEGMGKFPKAEWPEDKQR